MPRQQCSSLLPLPQGHVPLRPGSSACAELCTWKTGFGWASLCIVVHSCAPPGVKKQISPLIASLALAGGFSRCARLCIFVHAYQLSRDQPPGSSAQLLCIPVHGVTPSEDGITARPDRLAKQVTCRFPRRKRLPVINGAIIGSFGKNRPRHRNSLVSRAFSPAQRLQRAVKRPASSRLC